MSRLTRIYTVCHSDMILLRALFGTMDLTRMRNESVHFRDSGMKELNQNKPNQLNVNGKANGYQECI